MAAREQHARLNGNADAFPGGDEIAGGLTKREAFAMASLQGHRASAEGYMDLAEEVARWAVEDADALLLALEAAHEERARAYGA